MRIKPKYIVQIIVAIIGLAGCILGGSTYLSNNQVKNIVENNTNIEVNANDNTGDIILKLLEKNEELRDELEALESEKEQLQTENEKLSNSLENQTILLNETQSKLEESQKQLGESVQLDPSIDNTIASKIWIDQLDVFYTEGKNVNGNTSQGWHTIWDSSIHKDSLNDEHSHGIYIRSYAGDIYVLEYILDDSYTGFQGLFTLEYNSRNTQVGSNLKVYSVDEDSNEKDLLYSTQKSLYGGIEPIPFDFPIYGRKHIRIEISSDTGDPEEIFLGLVDACFYS